MIRSDGQYVRDYFYVEDGAAAYMLLAEKIANEPHIQGQAYNFSNELQLTVSQIVQKLLILMDSNLQAIIQNDVSNEIPHQYLSAEKARSELDWRPLFTLDQGLERTIAWYKDFLGGK